VHQAALVGVIECAGYGGCDGQRFVGGHTGRIAVARELCGVGAVDVVHRDRQLVVVLATVVHTDDVGMKKCGGQVGFADEALTELAVGSEAPRQDL
jgi:hypothetical protein